MNGYTVSELNNFKLNKSLVGIMALASGITVANLYYIQPLLADIARSFNVTQVSVGFVAMLTQVGYALGMLFLLPLADIREKKSIIVVMLFCAMGSLLLMAFAPDITIVSVAAFAVGFSSVVPQLIVPLAAQLADPKERGKIIGSVMSGLLIGILVSRTFSGFVGHYSSWRTVYLIAAALMVVLAVFLNRVLPACPPNTKIKYAGLFKTMFRLIKELPVLREASFSGAMMFAAFSAFWTTLAFLLESPHYNMGADIAGLFGLVGAAGAAIAPVAGRLADRRNPRFTIGLGIIVVSLSYVFFLVFGYQIWGLIIGVILLDVGIQACQISNQARIHALGDEARNRINTVYMVSYFIGGSFGSIIGSFCFAQLGWWGVCIFGLTTQLAAFTSYAAHKKEHIAA